jgi:import receptor subunit TOM70
MAPADSTPTLVERVTDFVSENKRAILVGTAAVLAVGGVLYVSSASSSRARAQDLEKGEKGQADKKKSSKKKTVKDADGPILEERKPKKSKVEDVGMYRTFLSSVTLSLSAKM